MSKKSTNIYQLVADKQLLPLFSILDNPDLKDVHRHWHIEGLARLLLLNQVVALDMSRENAKNFAMLIEGYVRMLSNTMPDESEYKKILKLLVEFFNLDLAVLYDERLPEWKSDKSDLKEIEDGHTVIASEALIRLIDEKIKNVSHRRHLFFFVIQVFCYVPGIMKSTPFKHRKMMHRRLNQAKKQLLDEARYIYGVSLGFKVQVDGRDVILCSDELLREEAMKNAKLVKHFVDEINDLLVCDLFFTGEHERSRPRIF